MLYLPHLHCYSRELDFRASVRIISLRNECEPKLTDSGRFRVHLPWQGWQPSLYKTDLEGTKVCPYTSENTVSKLRNGTAMLS